jgi:hypothetical protein
VKGRERFINRHSLRERQRKLFSVDMSFWLKRERIRGGDEGMNIY